MSRPFVLDENVIILAQTGQDQYGRIDPTCLDLLTAIERNCHSLVITSPIWARYCRQAATRQQRSTSLIAIITVLGNSAKDNLFLSEGQYEEVREVEGKQGVDVGDRDFVRAAASVPGSVLVSTDEPLRSALSANGIDQRYGFSLASPAEALPLAQSGDP